MKKRFSDQQIISILREAVGRVPGALAMWLVNGTTSGQELYQKGQFSLYINIYYIYTPNPS